MKRLTFLLYLFIIGLSGLTAADSLSVRLKVIDCDGSPLVNASLSVEGVSGKTNEEGYFSTQIAKKEGMRPTYKYEVYPTGYPYLTGYFMEEDLKEDVRVSYEHCVKLAIIVSGVYNSSDPYSGSINGSIHFSNTGYSFIATKEQDDAVLWTILNPVNSLVDIEISGSSYKNESFFYSTQLKNLSDSKNLILDIHKDLIKVNVNFSDKTRKYGTLQWFESGKSNKSNSTSISSEETLLLNPTNYQLIYSTTYSDEIDATIYSEIYEIKNIAEQTITIDANPENYRKVNIQVTGVPDTLHRNFYTEVTSNSMIERYGGDNLYFRNNYDLYLKDGTYNCQLYTLDNSSFVTIPKNVSIVVNGQNEDVLIDYGNYVFVPVHAQVDKPADDAFLNYILSDGNESVIFGKRFNDQWTSAAFLEKGKEYQIVSWYPGYQTIELKKSISDGAEIELNFKEYQGMTKVVIAPLLQSGPPSDKVKLTLVGIGEQTVSGNETAVFYNIPEGKYTLITEHPDCQTRTVEFEVDAEGNASINEQGNIFLTYMKSSEQYYMEVWLDGKDTGIFNNKVSDICSFQFSDHEITLSTENNNPIRVSIFNGNGASITTKTCSKHMTIPVSHWAKGIYILQVTSGNKTQTIKFIR